METDLARPAPQPVHKYPTRHKKWLKKVYNDVVKTLIAAHAQKKPEYMTDNKYLNILAKSIIDDEIGESLE